MDFPLVEVAVISQPLLWALLWNREYRIKPTVAQVGLVILAAGFYVFNVSYGNYTRELLMFYALATAYAIGRFAERPNLQPICLGFLLVFFNSFYWEFPIHVADALEGNLGVVIIQSLHLVAVPVLLAMGLKLRKRWWYTSLYPWILVMAVEYLRLENFMPYALRTPSLYVCRVAGLLTLLYIMRYPPETQP